MDDFSTIIHSVVKILNALLKVLKSPHLFLNTDSHTTFDV